jgi:Mg2+-importing ATPase
MRNKKTPISYATESDKLFGLTQDEATRLLAIHGPNEIPHDSPPHAVRQLLTAFINPFIGVLAVLAAISAFTDIWLPIRSGEQPDIFSVVIILTMICVSACLRFWQEYRSGKAAEALKSMVRTTATVLRHKDSTQPGIWQEIAIGELVVGDIIRLSAGDMVPADVRLLYSRDLFVSQSALTGEALPVEKHDTMANIDATDVNTNTPATAHALESSELCFMGTDVVSGIATAVVTSTGANTYFGSLAKAVTGSRADTAFDRGVNSVSWLLIRFMLVMVPVVLLLNGFVKGDWLEAILFALAVAVGLTPEMLPMIVSANLAKGAIAMSRRKVVVKRLNAIQNLGAMGVLCTDKTGTLTQDNILLEHHMDPNGNTNEQVLHLAWINSYYQSGLKNLIDQAVIRFANASSNDYQHHAGAYRKVDELPFDFMRRRLSVVVESKSHGHLLVCKGAVEEMLGIATHYNLNGITTALDDAARKNMLDIATRYNQDGFRVLLLGIRQIDDIQSQYSTADERDLIIEGFLTFLDPPKETAGPAIAALHEHGVSVKVLTGDNPVITARICHEVGLAPGTPLLGPEIELLDDKQLQDEVEQRSVFAKLTPLQKSRVLKALQANGHTVGFLGDGINDAPALRDADVGISVDSGTDIAKESADIILLEKSLMVLEEGVLKGRETFGNIMKYLNMTASSNFGNVFSVLIASAFIPFLPMLAIHLLIQNLLYDISQMAMPWDNIDPEFLKKPRKWDARNIKRFMLWIGPTSSIFDIATFAVMWFVFAANAPEHQALFQSGWFIEGLLSQTLVVHMLRTRKIPFVQSTAALPVLLMSFIVICVGIYLPFSPVGPLVGLQPLPWSYFPWLAGILLGYCLVAQTMKQWYIRRFGQWY